MTLALIVIGLAVPAESQEMLPERESYCNVVRDYLDAEETTNSLPTGPEASKDERRATLLEEYRQAEILVMRNDFDDTMRFLRRMVSPGSGLDALVGQLLDNSPGGATSVLSFLMTMSSTPLIIDMTRCGIAQ